MLILETAFVIDPDGLVPPRFARPANGRPVG